MKTTILLSALVGLALATRPVPESIKRDENGVAVRAEIVPPSISVEDYIRMLNQDNATTGTDTNGTSNDAVTEADTTGTSKRSEEGAGTDEASKRSENSA